MIAYGRRSLRHRQKITRFYSGRRMVIIARLVEHMRELSGHSDWLQAGRNTSPYSDTICLAMSCKPVLPTLFTGAVRLGHTSNQYRAQEYVDSYVHSPIRRHSIVPSWAQEQPCLFVTYCILYSEIVVTDRICL
jgi:hypothetical protein